MCPFGFPKPVLLKGSFKGDAERVSHVAGKDLQTSRNTIFVFRKVATPQAGWRGSGEFGREIVGWQDGENSWLPPEPELSSFFLKNKNEVTSNNNNN